MIDTKATIQVFGYNPEDLKPHSHKEVIAVCEECGGERVVRFQGYRDYCVYCTMKGERHPSFGKPYTRRSPMSERWKNKIRESTKGNKNHNWKGGKKVAVRKKSAKRRAFLDPNPVELNEGFLGSVGIILITDIL